MAMGEMAAAIVREISQPLEAVAANANAGLRRLAGSAPGLDQVSAALQRIANDNQRANEVIDKIRLIFNTDPPTKEPLDVNKLIREVITLVRGEIENQRVSVRAELADELPPVPANLIQLQQVIVNLVTNAVDAMYGVADRHRVLRIKTEIYETSHLLITRGRLRNGDRSEGSRQHHRAVLYNEIQQDGHGAVDLLVDHR
jgi:C4-dicarboxylate-specific signal transduction histidine kinase